MYTIFVLLTSLLNDNQKYILGYIFEFLNLFITIIPKLLESDVSQPVYSLKGVHTKDL